MSNNPRLKPSRRDHKGGDYFDTDEGGEKIVPPQFRFCDGIVCCFMGDVDGSGDGLGSGTGSERGSGGGSRGGSARRGYVEDTIYH